VGVRVSVSPLAMPIRLSPKSKARTVCAPVMPCACVYA